MRKHFFVTVLLTLLFVAPILSREVLAYDRECLAAGYTVVYVNGILTTRPQAEDNTYAIRDKFKERAKRSDVTFLTGFNQTHANGLGDTLKSVAQTYLTAGGGHIADYDLKTMLIDLSSQIHTQKVLLVGHSQGTFYTNAMYDYLVAQGMPASSIAVYNLATPADHVAGGGNYTTSSNDKLINYVRELDAAASAPQPMAANINIPIPYAERNDEWAGHHFQSDYLEGAPGQIVSDIQQSLARLRSWGSDSSTPCFEPPATNLAYKASSLAFQTLDSTTRGVSGGVSAVASAARATMAAVGNTAAGALYSLVPILSPESRAQTSREIGNALVIGLNDYELQRAKEEAAREAAAEAAAKAAQEAALEAAPRVEVYKPKPYVPPATSQAGAAALAFSDPVSDPVAQSVLAVSEQTLTPHLANPYEPGFGGGSGTCPTCSAAQSSSGSSAPASVPSAPATPAAPAVIPVAPDLSLTTPDDQSSFATTTVTFTGSSTPAAVITVSGAASGTATTDAGGSWSFTAVLATGTSTVQFVASKDSLDSATVSRTIGVALPPPSAPIVSATACTYSLSTSHCILPATSAAVSWTDPSAAASFDVYVNGVLLRSTTSTSTSVSLTQDATTTIEVVGRSASGETATSTALAIVSLAAPLRINEIAWAGTVQSANDQWLELRNASGYALDLSHVALVRSAGSELQLSGTAVGQDALGNGYFLVERTEAATDVHADLLAQFDLFSQTGERVSLVWYDGSATSTLDATPVVAACAGWCAGHTVHAVGTTAQPGIPNAYAMESMERIGSDGSQASSWQSNDTYTATAHDAGSYIIYGTPRAANSAGWPTKGLYCGSSMYTESSPTPTFPSSQFCVVLSRFISPMANRYVGYFIGDVGSSTNIGADLQGKVPTTNISLNAPGMNSGDHGLVVVWENRTNLDSDTPNFIAYFTGTQPTPPHSNYAVFPWVMQ